MIISVLDYLENTAARFPDKTAFKDSKESLSFKEIMDQARQIGSFLANVAGISPGRPVLVLMEKSSACIPAYMGIVYAGCYYVPIDESMPIERINRIIATLSPAALICSDKTLSLAPLLKNAPSAYSFREICHHPADEGTLAQIRAGMADTDLLYVLFTSGSTGDPKGVTISHRALIDFMENSSPVLKMDSSDILGNQAAFYFDLSILDLYAPLRDGSTTVIIPKKCFLFPKTMGEFLKKESINTIYWIPSALVALANSGILEVAPQNFAGLKKIYFCGEVMPVPPLNIFKKHVPGALYANMYGPTETTNSSTYFFVDRDFSDDDILPIGRPFPNTKILLLKEDDSGGGTYTSAPPGEMGEIAIGGSGLSSGYFNAPQLTEKSFINNPLTPGYRDTLYLTGDLGRYDEHGDIVFCGRKDFQIKHAGYRIELGEIEAAAVSFPAVLEAACLYDQADDMISCFYIGDLIESELISHMKERLQEYMIPERFVQLREFPKNANGKTDRKVLAGIKTTAPA